MALPNEEQIREALTQVIDPELRRNIVELGMVRSIEVKPEGQVDVIVSLTTPGCPIRSHFENAVAEAVGALEGVTGVGVGFDVLTDEEKGNLQQKLGMGSLPQGALAQVGNVICVASGKGGVGKSTMTANLAAALTGLGKSAGALDCDVYGYSIPRMLGIDEKPLVNGERKILPPESDGGVKTMSIGYFVEDNSAVVWRGPMLHKALQQFLVRLDGVGPRRQRLVQGGHEEGPVERHGCRSRSRSHESVLRPIARTPPRPGPYGDGGSGSPRRPAGPARSRA